MNKPYTILFPNPPSEIRNCIPAHCQFPLQSAQRVQHYLFEQSDFLVQNLHFDSFTIDSFELHSNTSFELNYHQREDLFFLIFMRKGGIHLQSTEGFYQNRVTTGCCLFFRQPSGPYRVQLKAGHHAGLCVCFSPEWAGDVLRQFPRFTVFGNHNFPACSPGPKVKEQLTGIYANLDLDPIVRRRQLSYYLTKALSGYYSAIQKCSSAEVYQARARIVSDFTDPALKPELLSKETGLASWILRYAFLKEFGISPAEFLRHKRLREVHYLKTVENKSFNQLYLRCGFNDESTVRAAYAKFFNP